MKYLIHGSVLCVLAVDINPYGESRVSVSHTSGASEARGREWWRGLAPMRHAQGQNICWENKKGQHFQQKSEVTGQYFAMT